MRNDQSLTHAEVFTEHHWYKGTVLTRGFRLADLLNQSATEVLEMHRVEVYPLTNPSSTPFQCAELLIKKDSIAMSTPTGSHEAAARRLYSYVEKKHYTAQIVLPGFTLSGTIHLPSRGSPWIWLAETSTEPSFVPITNVTVRFAAPHMEPLETKVIIFRRRFIESLFLSEAPVPTAEDILRAARELRDDPGAELAADLVDTQATEPEAFAPISIPIHPDAALQPSRPA